MAGAKIGIGVTGGIAAYKMADLVSRLTKDGFDVHVIMTENACQFITPLTMRTLSNNPVLIDMFDQNPHWRVQHIGIAEAVDLMVVAPATANILAKMAVGLADDLLSTVLLATTAPILLVPSMNSNMFANEAVQHNLRILAARGNHVMEPDEGELACGVSGRGRLPAVEEIEARIKDLLSCPASLKGTTVLVTAGPTREDLDPVRFVTNRSTGKMGYALAEEAARRGARVLMVSGPTGLNPPCGVEVFPVWSAVEMHQISMRLYPECDVVIGAAAVADYRPLEVSTEKIKKNDGDLVIRMTRNPDILADMGRDKGNRLLVGFAAETHDVMANGKGKLQKKNLDLVAVNDVTAEGAGFGGDTNVVTLVDRRGGAKPLPVMSKKEVAQAILDAVQDLKSL